MFGIALGIDVADFKKVSTNVRSTVVGILSQFVLLPLLTGIFILIVKPHPSFALGMILVAACPGGNISNFISSISNANVALSVTLTGFATLLTPLLTPLNFELWASLIPETKEYLKLFELSFYDIFKTVLLLLIIPLIAGMYFRRRFKVLTEKIEKPIRILSVVILIGFIAAAMMKNFDTFIGHLGLVFGLVLVHNAIAILSGYSLATLSRISKEDRRTVSIETGIQNSGLGLIIIFTFFDGNGGMAIIAAWWGVWHIISGLSLAYFFRWTDKRKGLA
jgi:BASS family bile acid:Na+ symporter